MRWPRALGAALYLLLALALAGTVVLADAPALHVFAPLAAICALAAYATEQSAPRTRYPWARSAAPALYVVAALLLPASWAVLVATSVAMACLLSARGLVSRRVAMSAHTVAVVTVFTVLAHLWSGDGVLLRHLLGLLPLSLHGLGGLLPISGSVGAGATLPRLLPAPLLALLAPAYYLLDVAPLVLAGALGYRANPWQVWRRLYAYAAPPEVALLSLGVLAAAMSSFAVARPLAALILLAGFGLHWAIIQAGARRAMEDEVRVLRANTADLYACAAAARERDAQTQDSLDAVLSAVRAIGGNEDLAEVTDALARATPHLTPFRACTVYLYESRDGNFVPYASTMERLPRHRVVSRGLVESLMSRGIPLSYSYYVPRRGQADDDAQLPASDDSTSGSRWSAAQGQQRVAAGAAAPAVGTWATGDLLLVPLLLKNGDIMGYIGLDRPVDGHVPAAADLVPLETVAFLAASVIARLRHTDEALHLAATDGLTGLLNRRTFEEFLRRELAAATRRRGPLSLLMIDLDDFGAINNTHGHQVGDAALRLVSGVIRDHLRESDAGGRYGGDEFVVILPGLDAAAAVEVAERLRAALVAAAARAAEGTLPLIHTSIGVAAFPADAADMDALIKAADDALYHSKRLGKNCVSVVSS